MLPFDLPWQRNTDDEESEADLYPDAIAVCECQDGTLAVYETEVRIERVTRSKFTDKSIPIDEITDVEYESGITVGYLQVQQTGVEADTGGMLSDPIDENTVHFTRGGRDSAKRTRDTILDRLPP